MMDADGAAFLVRIIDIIARSSLVEYCRTPAD